MKKYVYRGINRSKGEVYHGVSEDPKARRDGSHCTGGTKALKDWNCDNDDITWRVVSQHYKQSIASKEAHKLEKTYKHRNGLKNIKTRGI